MPAGIWQAENISYDESAGADMPITPFPSDSIQQGCCVCHLKPLLLEHCFPHLRCTMHALQIRRLATQKICGVVSEPQRISASWWGV